ncbi:hypothetical protein NDU88_001180 [Pleurodeles waltl]|uniref:Uncharacterized protein n=1 Tax=Pleurodeles waltl TaxID=8319 RepID=A0AAV7VWS9_PLEWA|nr:hypothetical protein NDU88_001180 [Pleurodeles waltl]
MGTLELQKSLAAQLKKGPTLHENHAEGYAAQEGVLGAGPIGSLKISWRRCKRALAAARDAMYVDTVLHGKARAYLHQHWTAGREDLVDYFRPPPVMQDPHSSG